MQRFLVSVILAIVLSQAGSLTASAKDLDLYLARRGVAVAALVGVSRNNAGKLQYSVSAARCSQMAATRLKESGFELVRMVINPLPLVQSDDFSASEAFLTVKHCASFFRLSSLPVIIDLHFWSPDPKSSLDNALGSEDGRQRYANALGLLAMEFAAWPQGSVGIELLNEPPPCDGRSPVIWSDLQIQLLAKVRAVAAILPVILSGCGGGTNGLQDLDVEPYKEDRNLIFSFHFYEPFIFTHQQVFYGTKFEHVRFPQQKVYDVDQLERATRDLISKAGKSAKNESSIASEVKTYLRNGASESSLEARFNEVDDWASKKGIPKDRIFLGEFGVVFLPETDQSGQFGEDALGWMRAVIKLADAHGYPFSLWGLPDSGPFRARMISAIGE